MTAPTYKRLRDWQSRFRSCVREHQRPFSWGVQDCCLFAADHVLAITGQDPAAEWRGSYANELGAGRLLQRLGGVRTLLDLHFGARVAPLLARVGDVGLLVIEGRDTMAVCGGATWLAPAAAAPAAYALHEAVAAWRVG